MSAALPDGYRVVDAGGARGFAWAAAAPWLEATLRDAGTLDAWAAARAHDVLSGGRAPVRMVDAQVSGPDARTRWAVRRFRRGGAVAGMLVDRYLRAGDERPLRELRASVAARSRGVRTPAVVAGAIYPSGAFYRADLVTELVPDARTLAESLFGREARPDAHAVLGAAGRLVRSLEDARLVHRDLNAGNILLRDTPGTMETWVLDLDRCRVRTPGGPPPSDAMRRRVERSLRKLGHLHARALTPDEWDALRAGYEERG